MMSLIASSLPFLMFAMLLIVLLSGFPVAFVLSGTALMFALIGHWLDIFYLSDLGFLPSRIWGIMTNFTLVAVPLFIFMGLTLERSGIAANLLRTISALFRRQRGSLAIAALFVGALLAASTGIVGATVVTMGVITLPTMLKEGYDQRLACGTIAASGTLGQIIPPSIVLVILGDMMNVDVGDLFVGALLPGTLLIFFYFLYIKWKVVKYPESAPMSTTLSGQDISLVQVSQSLLPPLLLILLVLGSILFGLASPTEAASCGAMGALMMTVGKKKLSLTELLMISKETAKITSMVFLILIGAQFFGVVFRGLGGDELLIEFIMSLSLDRSFILFILMAITFILGFYLDFLEICFIIIPIISPIFTAMGFNPLWVAILFALNLQTSFLTPPFGFALFYLKGIAPDPVTTATIYRGIIPFVIIQLVAMGAVAYFPALVTWLPSVVFR